MERDVVAGARDRLPGLRLTPPTYFLLTSRVTGFLAGMIILPISLLWWAGESIMNQSLKHAEEARLGTPCKYTASAATSRVYTELIYLPPVKETTIIIFTLHAAAS